MVHSPPRAGKPHLMHQSCRSSRRVARCVCASLAPISVSSAATIEWANPGGGTYQVGSNWVGGAPPGANDVASFALSDTPITVGLSASASQQRVLIRNGADVTINGSPFTLINNSFDSDGLAIGDMPTPSRLRTIRGNIGAFRISIGPSPGAAGIGTIVAPTSWGATQQFKIGDAGIGTLIAMPASFVNANSDFSIGEAFSGVGFFHNDGAFLSVNRIFVGRAGTGTLLITGDTSIGSGATVVGDQPGSHGVIDLVHNAEWSHGGAMTVGNAGDGRLIVHDGTIVDNGDI